MVVDKLKNYLITKVVIQGLKTIASILIPGAGFVKAAMAIVDIVMWLWNNAPGIADLIKTIAGSIKAIAMGATAAASQKIEQVLVGILPLAISFMASLLRLGDISKQVKSVVKTVQRPITKVINGVVDKAVGLGKKFLKTGLGKKLKSGYDKGKKKVKETFDKAKAKGEKAVQKAKKKIYGGDDSPEGKKNRERLAAESGARAANKYAGRRVGGLVLRPMLEAIRKRRNLARLNPIQVEGFWHIAARVDRDTVVPTEARPKTTEELVDELENHPQVQAFVALYPKERGNTHNAWLKRPAVKAASGSMRGNWIEAANSILKTQGHLKDADFKIGTTFGTAPQILEYMRIHEKAKAPIDGMYQKWRESVAKNGIKDSTIEMWHKAGKKMYRDTLPVSHRPESDFGSYLEDVTSKDKPWAGRKIHAHHIVMKKGGGPGASKSRKLLRDVGIDPTISQINLTWSLMKGVHSHDKQNEIHGKLLKDKDNVNGIVNRLRNYAEEQELPLVRHIRDEVLASKPKGSAQNWNALKQVDSLEKSHPRLYERLKGLLGTK